MERFQVFTQARKPSVVETPSTEDSARAKALEGICDTIATIRYGWKATGHTGDPILLLTSLILAYSALPDSFKM